MGLIEENDNEEDNDDKNNKKEEELSGLVKGEPASPQIYLAAGLEADGFGFGGEVADFELKDLNKSGDVGEYYKRMLREQPSNPLLLRNYAQFLQTGLTIGMRLGQLLHQSGRTLTWLVGSTQSQGDLSGAEDHYFRATLADPKDGEILMQYAKLVWEIHHDQDKASSYFEKAASAASADSHVLAGYASFLWEIEENGAENTSPDTKTHNEESGNEADLQNPGVDELERPVSPPLHLAAGLGIDAAGTSMADSSSIEEYYKRMVEENPCNPLFLQNYAEFLCQSKGDMKGAEEYYCRAILADPTDGEIISQYAKLAWQLHRDKHRATSYFERAVQASPESSNVLAAYARFLWESEEDEGDDIIQENHEQVSSPKGAMTTANAQMSIVELSTIRYRLSQISLGFSI